MLQKVGCLSEPEVAKCINIWEQYSLETNYIGSIASVGFFFFYMFYTHRRSIKLCSNTSII